MDQSQHWSSFCTVVATIVHRRQIQYRQSRKSTSVVVVDFHTVIVGKLLFVVIVVAKTVGSRHRRIPHNRRRRNLRSSSLSVQKSSTIVVIILHTVEIFDCSRRDSHTQSGNMDLVHQWVTANGTTFYQTIHLCTAVNRFVPPRGTSKYDALRAAISSGVQLNRELLAKRTHCSSILFIVAMYEPFFYRFQ
ncbi:hypothetical protein FISHEDRAFT_76690 [Fistulina hepatica ATCC 64428]|uniref:Uncharacterized protein n=1 Tax=Fistulina hepatica ATCC 64428 TaxID=1128425 RepID=A0A0D7A617_9AGAR|nr:hypothetical protein FISHEDRAFT_76690 [Fistulina hepatica ATCC 64428]